MIVSMRNSTFAILRHRGFRLFWVGALLSGSGVWVQNLALGWLIVKLSDSPMALGAYGFASLAPMLAMLLIGGTLADRVSRRRMLIVTQTILMAIALALSATAYFGTINYWQILSAAALTGTVLGLNSPAYQSIIPDLVPREELTAAVALNSVQFNVGRIAGHSLAGVALVAVGVAGCLLLNALSYLAMLYALCRIEIAPQQRPADGATFWSRAKDGVGYVRGHSMLCPLVLLTCCIGLLGLPYFYLLPTFGHDVLGVGPGGLGYLTAAVSIGGLAGGLLAWRVEQRFGKRLVLPVGATLFWVCLAAFASSRSYWLSFAALVCLGFFLVVTLAAVTSKMHLNAPNDMRGRVMSIHSMAINGLAPLGCLLAGAVAVLMSVPMAVFGMSLVGLCLTAVLTVRLAQSSDAQIGEVSPAV